MGDADKSARATAASQSSPQAVSSKAGIPIAVGFVSEAYVRTGRGDGLRESILTPEQDAIIDDALRGLPELKGAEIYANPAASSAMLEDEAFDVMCWLVQEIAGEFARTETFVRGPTRVLRDPFTNKPFIHFYATRGDRP